MEERNALIRHYLNIQQNNYIKKQLNTGHVSISKFLSKITEHHSKIIQASVQLILKIK